MRSEVVNIPKHLAIIMDGNGRWAKQRKLPRVAGHEIGGRVAKEIIKAAPEKGIEALTLFAFSCENWGRPPEEINYLMHLFLRSLEQETEKLHKNQVRIQFIGDLSIFDPELQGRMKNAYNLTAKNTRLKLSIAVNYSGRWDILQATQKIANRVIEKQLSLEDITMEVMQRELCLANVPEPDLFIRTSGELRISNFLLWQLAYTELYFTQTLWPDFSIKELEKALEDFAKRKRRFGLTDEQIC